MRSITVRVSEAGRLNLPAQLRREVGLEHGGPVVIRVEDGEIRIRTARAVMEELQAFAQERLAGSGDSVDQFLADRRQAAASEEEEDTATVGAEQVSDAASEKSE